MGARDGERRFFFVKVMKTAGGTLLQQILANFERERVYPYERYDPDMRDGELRHRLPDAASRRSGATRSASSPVTSPSSPWRCSAWS